MRASPGHSMPPELERSAPRDVGLTAGGRALTVLAWLLAAGAIGAGVALHLEAQRQSNAALDLDRRGVTAAAVVDRLWRKTGDGKPAFAAFHFAANGARVDGESRMEVPAWRELRTGSTIPVRYLPENPRHFVLAGQRRGRLPFAVAYVVSSVLAAMALLCLAPIHWQRRLLSEGRPALAVVTKVTKNKGSHGETHRAMVYQFRVLAGTMATGKATATKAAEVGATISVLYDPERPTRNRPYPFSLVTLNRQW
jgi:Na+-transporting NADH:ubiquinone oxidoreductase subunit NqrC